MTQNPTIYEIDEVATIKGASHISIANVGGADTTWEESEIASPTKLLPADYVWNSPESHSGFYTFTVDGSTSKVLVVAMGGTYIPQ